MQNSKNKTSNADKITQRRARPTVIAAPPLSGGWWDRVKLGSASRRRLEPDLHLTSFPIRFPEREIWEAKWSDIRLKLLILLGERGGTRTLDPMIKSHVLYRLSYALTRRAV
jgi:hypothetical protein